MFKFKGFEIRKPIAVNGREGIKDYERKFELCKKNKDGNAEYVVAKFYISKDGDIQFESIDIRLLQCYKNGLDKFLLNFVNNMKYVLNGEEC